MTSSRPAWALLACAACAAASYLPAGASAHRAQPLPRTAVRCVTASLEAPAATSAGGKSGWRDAALALAEPVASSAIGAVREAAADMARATELPVRKDEAWRRTDLAPLFATRLVAPAGEAPSAALLDAFSDAESEGMRLVFVDGVYNAALSDTSALPAGVHAGSLTAAGEDLQERALGPLRELPEVGADKRSALGCLPFAAINHASLADVACVHVPAAVEVERPLNVLLLSTGPEGGAIGTDGEAAASHPNLLVMLDAGAQLHLVQQYAGAGVYFANALSRVILGEGAQLRHAYVQEQAAGTVHVDSVLVAAQAGARYEMHAVQMGAQLSRVNLDVRLQGPHASCRLDGLALGAEQQLSDLHSSVHHESRDCESEQMQRNAVSDRARVVFKGAVKVPRGADNTTANQLCRSLLLSDRARVDVMPCLEIFTDEVVCTHGATVADLDDEMVFYLQSRGLDRVGARTLLLEGWAREVMNFVPSEGARRRAVAKAAQLSPEDEARRTRQQQSSRKLSSC